MIRLVLAHPCHQNKEGKQTEAWYSWHPKEKGEDMMALKNLDKDIVKYSCFYNAVWSSENFPLQVRQESFSNWKVKYPRERGELDSLKVRVLGLSWPCGGKTSHKWKRNLLISFFLAPKRSNRIWSKLLGYRWWNSTAYVLQVLPRTTYILALKYFTTQKMCW